MEQVVALGRRVLPRGWRDFGLQLGIWFGFYFTYLAVRHLTDRDPTKAVVNGLRVISFERHLTHHLFELSVERIADSSSTLLTATAWTYWNSEFTVIGLALLWVYLRRHEGFRRFRNTILLANVIGLVGFWLMPTAPPWMFPDKGFVAGVNHSSALLQTFGNSYAAMPSLHAADALIVAWFLVANSRTLWAKALWALWPLWVWFAAAILVPFENRADTLLVYWLAAAVFVVGSLLDILDGALARVGGKATPFGAFIDSTTDRVGEGAMLAAIALVFSRQGKDWAVVVAVAAVVGSFLVSYTRARAEALGLKGDVGLGSRAERVVLITAGLVFAPWGGLPWAIVALAATAWLTVVQRILHVRKQLSGGTSGNNQR